MAKLFIGLAIVVMLGAAVLSFLTKAQADKVDVKKCSQCHLDPKDKAPTMREMSLTKNPFHIRCIGCHKAQKKGPIVCTGCHVKK